jgi:hypothetical protein
MNKVVFVSDFFVEQIIGGGELNDFEVFKELKNKNFEVSRVHSHLLKKEKLNHDTFYIVSNFINLSHDVKKELCNFNYIIYEHDHKYLRSRNPAIYKNFVAPTDQIINIDFYKNAMAVLSQSTFHDEIINKNLNLNNTINLSGNMWSFTSLEFMSKVSKKDKKDCTSILNSSIDHKNTSGSILYCKSKNEEYELISDKNYYSFLSKLGSNRKFVFIPKTPETLSRICVEARMMNMSVVTNSLIGASKEQWFSLKGEKLINFMMKKRIEIIDVIVGIFNE